MQKEVCKLVGRAAKQKGATKKWQKHQTLYWQGRKYKRDSQDYQDLLDRAYDALSQNTSFQKALLATNNATLTHSMGKKKMTDTVLTTSEFISRLNRIRTELQNKEKSKK